MIENKKSNLMCIVLAMIVLFSGMCSIIDRTDSYLSCSGYISDADTIEEVKASTSYISNCTKQLISGLKNTFQKSRNGQGRILLKNEAKISWIKEILQILSYISIYALIICQPIEHSKTAILNYIHNQDGEK